MVNLGEVVVFLCIYGGGGDGDDSLFKLVGDWTASEQAWDLVFLV